MPRHRKWGENESGLMRQYLEKQETHSTVSCEFEEVDRIYLLFKGFISTEFQKISLEKLERERP